MKQDFAITFIILTFHSDKELLLHNIDMLTDYSVIVVDNTAELQEEQILREILPKKVHCLVNENIMGYAGGINK